MASGVDKNRLVLASGRAYTGTPGFVTPDLIGSNTTRYNTYFTGDQLGSIKKGTQVVGLKATYVMAEVETPSKLFRKDPISLAFDITGSLYEVSNSLLSTIHNRESIIAQSITIPATENWDITFLGSNIQPIVERGVLIQTRDVSGRNFEIGGYSMISTPEDWQLAMSGTDYILTAFKYEATPHPAFTTLAQDTKNYGYIARQNS